LRVLPGGRARRGVAAVPDRDVAAQAVERRLVEDLGDQAEVLVDDERRTVADGDPGRLLAAVLQGVEAVVGELGDVLAGSPDAEHAALLPRWRLLGTSLTLPAEPGRAGVTPRAR